MLRSTKVIFKRGEILNSSMLNELQNFYGRLLKIEYYNYSNGIIKGLDFFYDQNNLFISPGVLKFEEDYYFLENPLLVMTKDEIIKDNFEENEYRVYIYLKNDFSRIENNLEIKELSLVISKQKEKENIFLGTFMKRKNILPRVDYDNFQDYFNQSFIDIRERRYSFKGEDTLSPVMIRKFTEDLLENRRTTLTNLENYIMNRGLNEEVVSMDILKKYCKISGENIKFNDIWEKLRKKIEIGNNVSQNFEKKDNFKEDKADVIKKEIISYEKE